MQILIDLDRALHERNTVMVETGGSPRFSAIGYVSRMDTTHEPYVGRVRLRLDLELDASKCYGATRPSRAIEDQQPEQATATVLTTKQLENKS